MNKKIAFIGVGNMATATLTGITSGESSLCEWSNIILFEKFREKIEKYEVLGAHIAASLEEAVNMADYVLLCVKPQNFPEILPQISQCQNVSEKVFITIAAGIPMKAVSDAAHGAATVRVMPNTPMLIGKGMISLCKNDKVCDQDFANICEIFKSSGHVIVIDESEMNRIICVTGSSPAYVFLMIKAMYDGAVNQGLLKKDTDSLGLTEKELIDSICNTIIGTAELMKSGTKTPDEQIATVASKGGTTERAIAELHNFRFCEGIESAMLKCTERADELGKEK